MQVTAAKAVEILDPLEQMVGLYIVIYFITPVRRVPQVAQVLLVQVVIPVTLLQQWVTHSPEGLVGQGELQGQAVTEEPVEVQVEHTLSIAIKTMATPVADVLEEVVAQVEVMEAWVIISAVHKVQVKVVEVPVLVPMVFLPQVYHAGGMVTLPHTI